MKLNAGIVTSKLAETKIFYTEKLGFGITFENEWYLLLHTKDHQSELAFLLPELPTQHKVFQKAFPQTGGIFFTIEVDDIEAWYKKVKDAGIPFVQELKQEDWGDTHFTVMDPNQVAIDFVHYQAPQS